MPEVFIFTKTGIHKWKDMQLKYCYIDNNLYKNKKILTLVLKEVKRLCKEFGFTAGMLKGSLAKGLREK